MSYYFNQGVKAKMCKTTPFVNTLGTLYMAARARAELACDKIREQGQAQHTKFGTCKTVNDISLDKIEAQNLLADVHSYWNALLMRTPPFPSDVFHQVFPCHKIMMSTKPHRQGCHVWKDVCNATWQEVNELNPDVIVECYLDAKYYHYSPVELNDLSNVNQDPHRL